MNDCTTHANDCPPDCAGRGPFPTEFIVCGKCGYEIPAVKSLPHDTEQALLARARGEVFAEAFALAQREQADCFCREKDYPCQGCLTAARLMGIFAHRGRLEPKL